MEEIHLKRLGRLAKEHEKRAKRGERLVMSCYAFDCKTPACSLGHACFIPEFRKAGLHLVDTSSAGEAGFYRFKLEPKYRGRFQTPADGVPFFGLATGAAADNLFGDYSRSHAQQARVLRNFIAKQRKAMKQKRSA